MLQYTAESVQIKYADSKKNHKLVTWSTYLHHLRLEIVCNLQNGKNNVVCKHTLESIR